MKGESLHMTGRLLGHRRATTKCYAHLDDATLSGGAERAAVAVERKLRDGEWPPTVSLPGIPDTTAMRRNSGTVR